MPWNLGSEFQFTQGLSPVTFSHCTDAISGAEEVLPEAAIFVSSVPFLEFHDTYIMVPDIQDVTYQLIFINGSMQCLLKPGNILFFLEGEGEKCEFCIEVRRILKPATVNSLPVLSEDVSHFELTYIGS